MRGYGFNRLTRSYQGLRLETRNTSKHVKVSEEQERVVLIGSDINL